MRALVIFILTFLPAAAQIPLVQLINRSRPFSRDFQTGDRFEIRITAAPGQPVSVRTVRQGRTDWSPVIAATDSTGRWSTAGQFEKGDFGSWTEIWTVGGRLAMPVIQFSVNAPCLPGGFGQVFQSGPNEILTCDTAEGRQTFATPSWSDTLRTPDGRSVVGRAAKQTPEQYHMEVLSDWITTGGAAARRMSLSSSKGGLGDETAGLIGRMIGVNGLNREETQNVLAIIRAAFEEPQTIAPDAREPSRTLVFLRHLAELTDDDSLRQQIAGTIADVQAR